MTRFGYRNYILSNLNISSSNVYSPNYGPYTSQQYPSIVSNLNNGKLNGIRPTPTEFSIMNTGNDFSTARQTYTRVFQRPRLRNIPQMFEVGVAGSINGKFITPMSSSESIHLKKVANIGKSSLKQGLPNEAYYSNKCPDKNYVHTKLQRARSSGCVAPKKCGSIYNHQFTSVNAFTQSDI
jgi:hypothetical protein